MREWALVTRLVELLTEHTPLFEPFGSLTVVIGLFLVAWLVGRVAGRVAAWLIDRGERRRAKDPAAFDTGVLANLRQRQTAISLIQTSVRYLAFGIAIVLTVSVAIGARRTGTIVGASFLAIIIAFAAQRFLTDVIAGVLMFFEGWFRVGDMITIDPWKVQGVVEEFSVRSIKVRGIDGDVMRVPNSSVMATRVTPRGVRELEVELYVSDLDRGRALFEEAAQLVPVGPTHFVRRPAVDETERLGAGVHRVTGRVAVPPGREWLAEDFLANLLKERAAEGLILHGPVVMPSDERATRRFATVEREQEPQRRLHRNRSRRRRGRG